MLRGEPINYNSSDYQSRDRGAAVAKSQANMRQIKQRFEEMREQLQNLSWEEMKSRLVALSETPDLAQRKREILDQLSVDRILAELPETATSTVRKLHTFRGYFFEYLVGLEMNEAEENQALAQFILGCLRQPGKLDLELPSQKNPDHLGVIVDEETGKIYVTGMYEVKLNRLTNSGRKQIKDFYYNIRLIISTINFDREKLAEKFGLTALTGPIELKPFDELYKYVVVCQPQGEEERQNNAGRQDILQEKGWNLRESVFTVDDVDLLASYVALKLSK